MAISTEDAVQALEKLKSKAENDTSNYWRGVFIGACGAYLMAGVITIEHLNALTEDKVSE